ncbi:uncharacterized protein [Triticum aestivum]|uniref:uncharacterized protein isoform X5 n=1 Tax=Triticum aestivum TaxID=4565 RepID=UPI001D0143AD|nr:uncharacterized protein LOC123104234 isoform X5 [Triticum aestivum]
MDQPRSKTAEDLAAQRAACDRQMAAGRDRFASASAAVRAAARSAVSGAHQSLSRREDLVEFKKRLRDLEADLGQALSLKLTMESKCKRLRESISASAATSEQLRDLVTGQRSRSERHAAVISDVLEAAEAFEAKNDEDVTLMKGMEKAICWYQKRVGFQAVVEGEGDLPVSPTVCSDASAIPISSPVTKSVDSTSKNDRDKSNSQSKNRKPALPAKRKASALSAASPGSVRRSPRFVQGGTGESPADAYPDLAKLILNR